MVESRLILMPSVKARGVPFAGENYRAAFACTETGFFGSRTNSKRRIHWLGPGVNFHLRAACNARFPKNLLDSRDSFFTSTTLPLASTSARIRTVTFPRIVLRAFAGTSGKTSFTTARGTGFWRAGASTADLTGTATGCSGAELLRKKRGK